MFIHAPSKIYTNALELIVWTHRDQEPANQIILKLQSNSEHNH